MFLVVLQCWCCCVNGQWSLYHCWQHSVTEVTNNLDSKNFSRISILEDQILLLKNCLSEENAKRLSFSCNWVEAVEKRFLKSKYRIKNKNLQVGIINWFWFLQVISLDLISSTDSFSINNINKIYKNQICIYMSKMCQ